MTAASPALAAQTAKATVPPATVLRRKCDCGVHTPAGETCGACAAKTSGLQRKLAVGRADDPLEAEADRIANAAMAGRPQRPGGTIAARIQRRASLGTHEAGDAPASVHDTLGQPGVPLETKLRRDMEDRFGYDFSHVRVHSDALAARSAQDVGARAYTAGHHIAFAPGRYSPGTGEGRRLLAHELAHVVQQGGDASSADVAQAPRASNAPLRRSLSFESTIGICHRNLDTRKFSVSNGGVRVEIPLQQLDKSVPDCDNHTFWVSLMQERTILSDKSLATCSAETGGFRSFSFSDVPSGEYYLSINRNFDNPYCCMEGDIRVFDEKVTTHSSGCHLDKALTVLEIVHGALDIAGFIPVLGAIPDGVNAGIYVVEGDWANAGISAVASIPFWGDGVKLGSIAGKNVIKFSEKAALHLGEEGIAKGLKEAKAASKAADSVEKQGVKLGGEAVEKETANAAKKTAEEEAKEAAEAALKRKIKECEEIYASYEILKSQCKSCKATDTKVERTAKVACLTALLEGRRRFLAAKCDYVLPGSIRRGSAIAERGHQIQADQVEAMLLKCATLPTV